MRNSAVYDKPQPGSKIRSLHTRPVTRTCNAAVGYKRHHTCTHILNLWLCTCLPWRIRICPNPTMRETAQTVVMGHFQGMLLRLNAPQRHVPLSFSICPSSLNKTGHTYPHIWPLTPILPGIGHRMANGNPGSREFLHNPENSAHLYANDCHSSECPPSRPAQCVRFPSLRQSW